MRSLLRSCLISVVLALGALPTSAQAATGTGSVAFCSATASLYSSPAATAAAWPELKPSMTGPMSVIYVIQQLNNFNPNAFATMSAHAPSAALRHALTQVNAVAQQELTVSEKIWYGTQKMTSPVRLAEVATVEADGPLVRHLLAAIAAPLTNACAHFSGASLYNGDATQVTLRAVDHAFANGGIPTSYSFTAALQQPSHDVRLISLSSKKATYRVATITGWRDVCTTIPMKATEAIRIVRC